MNKNVENMTKKELLEMIYLEREENEHLLETIGNQGMQIDEAKTAIKNLMKFLPDSATAMKSEAVQVLASLGEEVFVDFKTCMNLLLQNYFHGDGQLKMINDKNNLVICLASQSCADCSATLYLICNVLEDMISKYDYDLCVGNYNPYFNPLENDKDSFMTQVGKFVAHNYLFDTTKWEIKEND